MKDDTVNHTSNLNSLIEYQDIVKVRLESIEMNMKTVMR